MRWKWWFCSCRYRRREESQRVTADRKTHRFSPGRRWNTCWNLQTQSRVSLLSSIGRGMLRFHIRHRVKQTDTDAPSLSNQVLTPPFISLGRRRPSNAHLHGNLNAGHLMSDGFFLSTSKQTSLKCNMFDSRLILWNLWRFIRELSTDPKGRRAVVFEKQHSGRELVVVRPDVLFLGA